MPSSTPRRAKPGDYDALVPFLDRNFPANAPFGGMARSLCHIVTAAPAAIRRYFVIDDGPRIASTLNLVPLPTRANGARLTLAGIGAVATDADYRGQGLMSAQLCHCIETMLREGYPASILWGNRQRYGRYGWELAGREERFTLDTARLAACAHQHMADAPIADYDGSDAHRRLVNRLYSAHALRQDRPGKLAAAVLMRSITSIRLTGSGRNAAYVAINLRSPGREIIEYGGSLAGFVRLALDAAIRHEKLAVEVIAPSSGGDAIGAFCREVASFRAIKPLGMIRINRLPDLLAAYAPVIERRLAPLGRVAPVSLSIRGRDDAPVRLPQRGGGRPIDLALGDGEAVRLLFGPLEAHTELALPEAAGWLRGVFPLPLYVWPLNHV